MIRKYLSLALALAAAPAAAQNAPSNSSRVQGTPDGYGDPVQVTVVNANGSDTSGIPAVGEYNSTPPTLSNGSADQLQLGARGSLRVELFSAGSTAGATINTATSDVGAGIGLITASVPKATTAGGLSVARVVTGTTGVIKASAGQLYTVSCHNSNAAVRYAQLYNKATAPTLSTDTPQVTIPLTGSSVTHMNFTDIGVPFATGMSWAYTTDDVAIPTTAGTSGELHCTFGYK